LREKIDTSLQGCAKAKIEPLYKGTLKGNYPAMNIEWHSNTLGIPLFMLVICDSYF